MITINLLSPHEKQERARTIRERAIFRMLRNASLMVVGASFVLLSFHGLLFLKMRALHSDIREAKAKVETKEMGALEDDVALFEKYLTRINALLDGHTAWSRILRDLSDRIPEGIQLTRLDGERRTAESNRQEVSVRVNGRARSRDEALALRTHILESPFFATANFPLANLEAERNIEFSYTFFLKEGALTEEE